MGDGDGVTNTFSLRCAFSSTTSEIPTTQGLLAIIVDMVGGLETAILWRRSFTRLISRRELVTKQHQETKTKRLTE